MKTKLMLFSLVLLFSMYSRAQNYVTIPDANFVTYLTTNFGTCMNGNQLDTTCQAIKNTTYMDLRGEGPIHNLNGIQFFKNLQALYCQQIELETVPALPSSLYHFRCDSNKLVTLPVLPKNLDLFTCDWNKLETLPALPDSLTTLHCNHNQLTSLPPLKSLRQLSCAYNKLINLPDLPFELGYLECGNNQLTSLPLLPPHLSALYCSNNKISCFKILPPFMKIDISNNPFTCLPNYTAGMDSASLKYPLCKLDDKVNNPNDCPTSVRIKGNVYKDINTNCIKDLTDTYVANVTIKLYDNTNKLVTLTSSDSKGEYVFFVNPGTYRVTPSSGPYTTNCPDVTVTVNNTDVDNINFGLICKPGFDIGTNGIWPSGKVFPGQQHRLTTMAGDLSQWNHLDCDANINGAVKVTVSGPVTYAGPAQGALTPTVSGNVFTYAISDFSTINVYGFQLLFNTNTTATADDSICVTVNVTPVTGDNNPSNNAKHFCYKVFNSYDPNLKEVYPLGDLKEGFSDWFTYTIHFQNTGNAAAIDIALTDSLDQNLDPETLQILNYSHYNQISLVGNALYFKFPDIQLADSTSNPEGSKGFIQYRIKPKTALMAGTSVKNRAFIYFDYNKPIITNTTVNRVVKEVSVEEEEQLNKVLVYPNPGNGLYHIKLPEKTAIQGLAAEVYNLLGKMVWNGKLTAANPLDITGLPQGIYFLKITDSGQVYNQRLIKR